MVVVVVVVVVNTRLFLLRVYSSNAQMTSKRGIKNKEVIRYEPQAIVNFRSQIAHFIVTFPAVRDLYRPPNDPRTGNDPQIGPQMIPGPEMILKVDRK